MTPPTPPAGALTDEQIAELVRLAETRMMGGNRTRMVAALRELQAHRAAASVSGCRLNAAVTDCAHDDCRVSEEDEIDRLLSAAPLACFQTRMEKLRHAVACVYRLAERAYEPRPERVSGGEAVERPRDCGSADPADWCDAWRRETGHPPAAQEACGPKATCATHGHLYNHDGRCIFCDVLKCDEPVKPEAAPMRDTESSSGVPALGSSGLGTSQPAAQEVAPSRWEEKIAQAAADLLAGRKNANPLISAVRMAVRQGCGDNSCEFRKPTGMGTNGGCRCWDNVLGSAFHALSRVAPPAPSVEALAREVIDIVLDVERSGTTMVRTKSMPLVLAALQRAHGAQS